MVEEQQRRLWPLSGEGRLRTRWRHADVMDLTHPELRKILELQDTISASVQQRPLASEASVQKSNQSQFAESAGWRYAPADAVAVRQVYGKYEPNSALLRRSVMRVGVPKEIKVHEYRVGLVPSSVREVVSHGHEVILPRRALPCPRQDHLSLGERLPCPWLGQKRC